MQQKKVRDFVRKVYDFVRKVHNFVRKVHDFVRKVNCLKESTRFCEDNKLGEG